MSRPPDLQPVSPPPLSMKLSLSRPAVLPHHAEDEPLHVLIRIWCSGRVPTKRVAVFGCSGVQEPPSEPPEHLNARPPLHLGLVLDASGSMHRIVLAGEERQHWRQVGQERGDLKWGRVDGREGCLWSGRTLEELQARHRTPMQAALRALTRTGERLQPEDGLTVIAFADRAQLLVRADDADRAGRLQSALRTLSPGVDEENLGSGTRLAEALRLALEEATAERRQAPARLLLISDGLVEDRVSTCAWVERVADAGIPLSCIGVGDQFDEELLMWAADTTRGRFRYTPTPDELEAAVVEELDRLERTAARRLTLTLRPRAGSLFRDLCQVTPDLSALHRMETDGAGFYFSLGDLPHGIDTLFLAELSLPPLPPGEHGVLSVELTGESPDGAPLTAAAEAMVQATADLTETDADPADLDAVAAAHAYRAERCAQRALRRGQVGEATRHLRDTRQIVAQLGHADLAAELEAHVAAVEAGAGPSPDLAKRIKSETRRLME